ncbi:hypothetical protein LJC42_04450 [Eubacteriales bacterium OttesenSCG-928-K08]|nr:hypothetical protein [Eubacteriales bacterium OttesenSCG-928-K08]
MEYVITPKPLAGVVKAQPSKSAAQRLLICSSLANGQSVIDRIGFSDDIKAAWRVAAQLGLSQTSIVGRTAIVNGGGDLVGDTAFCGESGAVLRLMLPLAFLSGKRVTFSGAQRHISRPMDAYAQIVTSQGGEWTQAEQSVTVRHKLRGGEFRIVNATAASQFLSGLMLALPLVQEDSVLHIIAPEESLPYVLLTQQTQRLFGVECDVDAKRGLISIPGGQTYLPANADVEGDWSHAAYAVAAGAIGEEGVSLRGLDPQSLQADKNILLFLNQMGGHYSFDDKGVLHVDSAQLRPITVDISECPDLLAVLAVLACAARGTSRITNRLQYKENSRFASLSAALGALGGKVSHEGDGLVIQGTGRLRGGEADCFCDHRVAMALAVASSICDNPVTLVGTECVRKSAPLFWDEFKNLGGQFDERAR